VFKNLRFPFQISQKQKLVGILEMPCCLFPAETSGAMWLASLQASSKFKGVQRVIPGYHPAVLFPTIHSSKRIRRRVLGPGIYLLRSIVTIRRLR